MAILVQLPGRHGGLFDEGEEQGRQWKGDEEAENKELEVVLEGGTGPELARFGAGGGVLDAIALEDA